MSKTRPSILLASMLAGLFGCEDCTEMPPPGGPTVPGDPGAQGPAPDIALASLSVYPREPIEGHSFMVYMTIRNTGAAPVPAGTTHIARWYPGGNLPGPACEWSVAPLGPGQQVDVSCTYAGYTSTYSNLETTAVLDATDTVDEPNEDNTWSLPINVVSR